MATTTLAARRPRARSMGLAWAADRRFAGALLFSAGAILLMGIITAEALYPVVYSTAGNEISDLGGTRPPEGLVFQPSATIFNASIMLTGLLVAIAALVVHRAYGHWSVSTPIAGLGLAALAVGIFPGPTGNPHAIAAMVAFFSGGFAAVLSARVVRPPFRYPLLILGVITLASLASYFTLGDANPMWELGVGGAERWVAYPEILWLMGFGGYLAGRADGARDAEQETAGTRAPEPRLAG
jgi:hypothetical membrane protein